MGSVTHYARRYQVLLWIASAGVAICLAFFTYINREVDRFDRVLDDHKGEFASFDNRIKKIELEVQYLKGRFSRENP